MYHIENALHFTIKAISKIYLDFFLFWNPAKGKGSRGPRPQGPEGQRFFFPMKIKSARESFFWPFFDFFHGWKMAFTHTFFEFFTGGPKFSRTLVRIFSRVDLFFSCTLFSIFSTPFSFFHGYSFFIFSRAKYFVSRREFGFFHGLIYFFTGTIFLVNINSNKH